VIGQRIRQFVEAGRLPADDDLALARELLPAPLLDLFLSQHPRDIVHGASTARWLIARGEEDPDLLVAAMVHDVGKGHQRRADRAAYVALERAAASPGSRFELRRAMARTRDHSHSGAALLEAAGARPRVVELTLRHHDPRPADPVIALLQRADAAS
jgi:hypothetical protein